jgi:threonine dehydratase
VELPDLAALDRAARLVYEVMAPTPQVSWPLLNRRLGAELWIKHENHTPVGAFKIRGGLVYFDELTRREPSVPGVVAATRGNHGQSIAFAAQRHGLRAAIVVPHGNSRSKNAAMRARGAELIEHGDDFQAAAEHAGALAATRGWHLVPSFHEALVRGVAGAALELFRAVPDIDSLYVPLGMGSGVCAAIAAREALGLKTVIVAVAASVAPAYAQSFAARRVVSASVGATIADGVACRTPSSEALAMILQGVDRVVAVDEIEIRAAMRHLFDDTHNVAEGAGAIALAAITRERSRIQGRRVAMMLSGGNVDRAAFAGVVAEETE